MHCPLASHVEPWRAAAAGEVLRGTVAPERVPRLAAFASPRGSLAVAAAFTSEPGGAVRIALEVEGRYAVTCQRCLQPLELARRDRCSLLVAGDERSARALEERDEVVVCAPGEVLHLAALVEDEVLLALPFAPCHAQGACDPGWRPEAPPEEVPASEGQAGRNSPFAALAALREAPQDDC